jgi:hypothetical protein
MCPSWVQEAEKGVRNLRCFPSLFRVGVWSVFAAGEKGVSVLQSSWSGIDLCAIAQSLISQTTRAEKWRGHDTSELLFSRCYPSLNATNRRCPPASNSK